MKSKKTILCLVLTCALPLLSFNSVQASDFNAYQNEIQNKQQEILNKKTEIEQKGVSIFDSSRIEFKKKLPMDIPTEFQIKDYDLKAYDGVIPQIGEFRSYADKQFQQTLSYYQGLYDSKSSELHNSYNSKEKQINADENKASTSYNSDLKSLQNAYQADKKNMAKKYNDNTNSLLNSLNNQITTSDKKYQADVEAKRNAFENPDYGDALKNWKPGDNGPLTAEINAANQQFQETSNRIKSFEGSFYSTYNDMMNNYNNYNPSDLKQKLESAYPGFLSKNAPFVAPAGFGDLSKYSGTLNPSVTTQSNSEQLYGPEFKSYRQSQGK